ncbi:MAG TPA: CHAD domain-containing protein [Burkholderiales bacterium]|nr:CHAD domain-containing protein [Burkholderiales bacterium]
MPVAAARRAVMHEALEQIRANIPGSLAGRDPEYLHQLRVGTRRLRAALRVFRGTMQRREERALLRTLRKIARASGPARDWDVNVARLPVALRAEAARRRRAAHAQLRRVIGAAQLWMLPRGLAGTRPRLDAFARAVLESLDRKSTRQGKDIDWNHAGQRHALRVRLRRLRYACEFLGGAFPGQDNEPLVRSLKRLQDLLGELNDMEVARRLVRELRGGKRTRRAPGPRERKLVSLLPAAWRRFTCAPRFWR